ncbi:MAG: hypothetical protein ACRD3O_09615 [Terriglobia bacterium]
MQNDQNELKPENSQRLPLQAGPVTRTVANPAISGDAGVEASGDYNDPSYFFLNWPVSA